MNRDDIIRMAREAGFPDYAMGLASEDAWQKTERFAALVAAAERERMKSEGWRQCAKGQRTTQYCGLLEAAVQAEREACAKLCEETTASWTQHLYNEGCVDCAKAIRARGESK
jgi:hypothetical protein